MLSNYSNWLNIDFTCCMFLLALLVSFIHKFTRKQIPLAEIVYRWFILLPVGLVALFIFLNYTFSPDFAGIKIGWHNNYLFYQIGIANLGLALIAILSFNATLGFRWAAVVANTCWLWGEAVGHMFKEYFTFLTASSAFWLDLSLPILLMLCLIGIKNQNRSI